MIRFLFVAHMFKVMSCPVHFLYTILFLCNELDGPCFFRHDAETSPRIVFVMGMFLAAFANNSFITSSSRPGASSCYRGERLLFMAPEIIPKGPRSGELQKIQAI